MELMLVIDIAIVIGVVWLMFMLNRDTVIEMIRVRKFDAQFKCPADVVSYAIESGQYNPQLYMCFVIQNMDISATKKQQVYSLIDDSLHGNLSLTGYLIGEGVYSFQEVVDRKKEFWQDWVNNPKHNVPFK